MVSFVNNSKTFTLEHDELEKMLNQAAERGARKALSDVGLENGGARGDIRELRSLLQALRFAKQTAWQTVIRIVTTGLVLGLMATSAIKLKLFGGS
jgi:Family of unknown function (DUF6127)